MLVEVMRETTRARGGGFARGALPRRRRRAALRRGGARARRRRGSGERLPGLAERAPRGTTHISVVDARGNAASMTVSTGSGSGVIVPGTGIHLNNMLGEYDLAPSGRARARAAADEHDGALDRARRGGRPRLVVGSAGSVRLRGAILQIVVNVVAHGLGVEEAIERPRVHLDEPHVHCEGGHDPAELDRLEAMGYDVVRWRRRNLYFGGAAGGRGARRRRARGGGRLAPRRARRRRAGVSGVFVRRAEPADAQRARRGSPRPSAPSPGGWLISTSEWRSVADERRYLRAVRRSDHAAVFVAEADGEIVGRMSLARDPHPASFHVADLGLMVDAALPPPRASARRCSRRRSRGRARSASRSSSCTCSRTTRPRSPSTSASGSSARATAATTTGAPAS